MLERKKWTNKGTDKPYVADSLKHSTTCQTMYVPNFKILGQVVPAKSLTKVSIFITLELEKGKGKNRKTRQKLFSESWLYLQ